MPRSVLAHIARWRAAVVPVVVGIRHALRSIALVVVVALSNGLLVPTVQARPAPEATTPIGVIRAADLPPEGRQVLARIRAGGPFVSHRDGIVFANRERILPGQTRGYYAEYTVPTPGSATRGARRIIAGRGAAGDFRTSGEYYYTSDHYQSFRRIAQ